MVVDLPQDSDSDSGESSNDQNNGPAPDNLVWLHPEQIIDRDSLNTRPVHQNLLRELNNSGMFVEEIIRYIHHMVERCHTVESSGIVGRVPVNRHESDNGLRQTLGQIIGLIGTSHMETINPVSSEPSIVSIQVVDDPEIVSVVDEAEDNSLSSDLVDEAEDNSLASDSSDYYPTTTCPDSHAIYIDNITRSHRILYRSGLRMFPEVRCQVAILPRELPDRCSVCMAPVGDCPIPCHWRPNYSRACSRRCDEQIRTNKRRTCPMWDIFEVVDSDPNPELSPPHEFGRLINPDTGTPYDPLGATVYLRPLDFVDVHADYLHLRDITPDRQYGDRDEDHRRSMTDFQTAINVGNRQYLESMRRTRTPPNGSFSGFEINFAAPTGQGHAVRVSRIKPMATSGSPTMIEFEWDSDSSHHFTGIKSYYLPDTFVSKRMRVRVASGKIHYAEGYGRMAHPMLQKVWYVPGFTCNLFSDAIAMGDGYSCRRMGRTLEYLLNDEVILEGVVDKSKWILQFNLSPTTADNQNLPSYSSFTSGEGQELSAGSIPNGGDSEGQAMGTGMGLLPVAAQTVLMHRRCNHVTAEVLYLAIHKELTTCLCASPSTASLTHLNATD